MDVGQATEIPTSFYIIVGGLVVANLGTVISIIYGIGRLVWYLAKLDSRVSVAEDEIKETNERIRELRTVTR